MITRNISSSNCRKKGLYSYDRQEKFFSTNQQKIIQEHIITLKKIATCQGDDHTIICLLAYNYLDKYYKMIIIDLSKHQALNTDTKAMKLINFTGTSVEDGNADTAILFIIEERKETI